jgi:membrane protein
VLEQLTTYLRQFKFIRLLVKAGLVWQRENCAEMGAALSYYALFSLFPILLVILSIFGFWLGSNTYTYRQIVQFTERALPPAASDIVQNTLINLNESSFGAGIVGFSILVFAASGVFAALTRACNRIWGIRPHPDGSQTLLGSTITFVRQKIFSLVLVLGTALLVLLSFLSNLVIGIAMRVVNEFSETMELIPLDQIISFDGLQTMASFVILGMVLLVLYKILPTTYVAWRDVWLGALLAATVLLILQQLVSQSIIEVGSRFASYGVVGGVMVLLFWIYITCQIFFFGSAITYCYAEMYGSRRDRPPSKGDVPRSDTDRAAAADLEP